MSWFSVTPHVDFVFLKSNIFDYLDLDECLNHCNSEAVGEFNKLSDFSCLCCRRWKKQRIACLGRNAIWHEFSIGQLQIKGCFRALSEIVCKLRRNVISGVQTVLPRVLLQVNVAMRMPIAPLEELWNCKPDSLFLIRSQSLLPHAHSLHHLSVLSRESLFTSQVVLILKNWSRFVPSSVYVKFVICGLSKTKS